MKVFISSLISGFEPFREAARGAILTLRHEPIRAEDFAALPTSPQIACMRGVRAADVVVLILGANYGYVQGTSGLSPTHEEYIEARGTKPILMFVQEGVDREAGQQEFVTDVQGWQGGGLRAGFKTPEELRDRVTRALHEFELANAAGPVDAAAICAAADNLLPRSRRGRASGAGNLIVAVSGGPARQVLRPAALEAPELLEALQQRAMFGTGKIFDKSKGMDDGIEGSALYVEQESGARVQLDQNGSMLFRIPLGQTESRSGFPAIIEEDVMRALVSAIAFADWAWEKIDPTQKLSHAAIAAMIETGDFIVWRTRAEQEASPRSASLNMSVQEPDPVRVDKPRAALTYQATELAEDLMVPLRRQWKR